MEYTKEQVWQMLRSGSYGDFMTLLPSIVEGYNKAHENCLLNLKVHEEGYFPILELNDMYRDWPGDYVYREKTITICGILYNVIISSGYRVEDPRGNHMDQGTVELTLLLKKDGDNTIYVGSGIHSYLWSDVYTPGELHICESVVPLQDYMKHLAKAKNSNLMPSDNIPHIPDMWSFLEAMWGYVMYTKGERNMDRGTNNTSADYFCGTYHMEDCTWEAYRR